ncbi:MAG: hypothetical protein WBF93_13845, partial [Pirellulales bacterium]
APAARSAKPEATSRPAAPPRQESKRSVPVAPVTLEQPPIVAPPIPAMPSVPQAGWQKGLMLTFAAITGVAVASSIWMFLQTRQRDHTQALPGSTVAVETSSTEAPPTPTNKDAETLPNHARRRTPGAFEKEQAPADTEAVPANESNDQPSDVVPAAASSVPVDSVDEAPAASDLDDVEPVVVSDIPVASDVVHSARTEPAAHPIPQPTTDTLARLNINMDGVEFNDTPLNNVISVIQQITAVPIQLDHGGLFRAGVPPNRAVRLKLEKGRATDVLQTIVDRLGLVMVPTAERVIISVPTAAEAGVRTRRLEIGDLAGNEIEVQRLSKMLKSLVLPATWHPMGHATLEVEGSTLHINQSVVAHRQLQDVVDRLRVARGLPARGRQIGSDALKSRSARAADAMNRIVSCGADGTVPLDDYLSRLSYRGQISLSLDELSLIRYGVSPQIHVTAGSDEKPIAAVLAEALEPVGLTWRVLDDGLLEVTTPLAIEQTPDIELYKLANSVDGASLTDRIRKKVAPQSWSANVGGAIWFDRDGGCLLVRQTQPLQRAVERQLTQWQALR